MCSKLWRQEDCRAEIMLRGLGLKIIGCGWDNRRGLKRAVSLEKYMLELICINTVSNLWVKHEHSYPYRL